MNKYICGIFIQTGQVLLLLQNVNQNFRNTEAAHASPADSQGAAKSGVFPGDIVH